MDKNPEHAMHRADLLKHAIDCPHTITDEAVTLYFDSKKTGNNALHQLGNRLNAASGAGPVLASHESRFEEWHTKHFGYAPVRIAAMNGLHRTHTSRVAWNAWQAAIESVTREST